MITKTQQTRIESIELLLEKLGEDLSPDAPKDEQKLRALATLFAKIIKTPEAAADVAAYCQKTPNIKAKL